MGKRLDPKEAEATMVSANLKPLEKYKSALTRWKCQCLRCGSVVHPTYNAIQQGRGGCITCGIKKTTNARKLDTSEVKKRLNQIGLQLAGEYKNVEKELIVKCMTCKQVTTTTLQGINRKNRNFGCETCARKASGTLANEKVFADMKRKGLLPLESYKGFREPWLCECLICHANVLIARESIRRRSPQFMGCLECAKKAQNDQMVSKNKNRILKRFESRNLRLISEYVNSRLPVEVECMKCGYKFSTEGSRLGQQKYGCAKCAGNFVDPIEAIAYMELNGFLTLEPFTTANKSWKSTHLLCGNTVSPSYSSIKSGNGGCRYCAEYGFQYSKPAYLYLITNERLNAHKIGIANPAKVKKSDRLHRYKHHGWSVVKVWDFPNGKLAENIENAILLHLKVDLGISSYLSSSEMGGQGGHTETVDADSISLVKLERLINKAIKGLKK